MKRWWTPACLGLTPASMTPSVCLSVRVTGTCVLFRAERSELRGFELCFGKPMICLTWIAACPLHVLCVYVVGVSVCQATWGSTVSRTTMTVWRTSVSMEPSVWTPSTGTHVSARMVSGKSVHIYIYACM